MTSRILFLGLMAVVGAATLSAQASKEEVLLQIAGDTLQKTNKHNQETPSYDGNLKIKKSPEKAHRDQEVFAGRDEKWVEYDGFVKKDRA